MKSKHQEEQSQPVENNFEQIMNQFRTATIHTEEDWLKFKILFETIYKDFFAELYRKIPDITPSEIRLMALSKLGLPTKEMAVMMGIVPDSIRKARYRLRKKIEHNIMEEHNDIFSF